MAAITCLHITWQLVVVILIIYMCVLFTITGCLILLALEEIKKKFNLEKINLITVSPGWPMETLVLKGLGQHVNPPSSTKTFLGKSL